MKATIESTSKIVHLSGPDFNGVPARVWEGETETGIKVHFYVTRVAVDKTETNVGQFEKELSEQQAPSPEVAVLPLRMIL